MTRIKIAAGFLLGTLLLGSALTWAQANVDESQETAKLYVDAATGSDNNPGTEALPLRTITQATNLAIANNRKGIGTKVIINPGTYRETVVMRPNYKDTSLPITLQAATPGTAILSGADVWGGWKVTGNRQVRYSHAWPYQWGVCPPEGGDAPPEPEIVRRREMIFVNGTAMTQVLTAGAMRKGTFYVDEAHGVVYLFPPLGTDMSKAAVEVATREVLLQVGGKSNIVLRGLTYQHANSCRGDGALYIAASSNILVDKNFFYWNNSAGVRFGRVSNITLQNSTANYNGTSGMKTRQSKHDLWQNNQAYYNGWRGAQGVYYKWGESGMHFALAHDETVSKLDSSWNQTSGFHWDTDNENVTADSLTGSQNLLSGMVVERSQGPMTISNSVFCNGNPQMSPTTFGFHLRNSSYVTLTGTQMRGNRSELGITGDPGGWPIQNWETGQNLTAINKNFTSSDNVLEASSDQQAFNDGSLGGSDWTLFQTTLSSDYNTWWNGESAKTFLVPDPNLYTKTDFPGWQSTSGADAHSVWKTPGHSGARCNVITDATDFWFIMDYHQDIQTVSAGSGASFTGYLVPVGGFIGLVNLHSDGEQNIPGAKAGWSPKTLTESGSSTFTITTSKATPKGTYPLTLTATSDNVTRIMTAFLVVQ